MSVRSIAPCLWFDTQAEEAVEHYLGIFKGSKITKISRYGKEGQDIHKHAPGSVMSIAFELNGQAFTALNGGPEPKFNEAISLQVICDTQAEIDHYWERLGEGGDESARQCGWLKDRYGVSWQIVPAQLLEMVADPDSPRSQHAIRAMFHMKKLDIAALQRAYDAG